MNSYTSCVPAFIEGADSPRHFLERCLEQLEALEKNVQAFVALDVEAARRAADDASVRYRSKRPLSRIDGMPVGVKDIIHTRGLPTQMNSPIYAGFQSRRDAACVIGLKKSGAYVFGKTVTAEFACGRSGATRNPFDFSRTPGGSSSGSAAAVGSGMLPAALGTQSQASIIRPASYCGAYAMKPSHGALNLDGVAPLSASLDHLGAFGASLEDVWCLLAAMASAEAYPSPRKPQTLIRLETVGWRETDTASREAFDTALATLARAGVRIYGRRESKEVERLEQEVELATTASTTIYAYESQWPLRSYLECGPTMVGERVKELIAIADRTSPRQYNEALDTRRRFLEALNGIGADALVTLSSSGPAIPDIAYTGSRSFAVPATTAGVPSVSLPRLTSGKLPLGLQVIGAEGKDLETMAIAAWLDQCLGASC